MDSMRTESIGGPSHTHVLADAVLLIGVTLERLHGAGSPCAPTTRRTSQLP